MLISAKKLLALVLAMVCLCGCFRAKVDYGQSELYSLEEREAAVAIILAEFNTWEGCRLHRLAYMGDECNSEKNIEWMQSLGGKEYTQCIAFTSNFHSPVLGGGAWNTNEEYRGWTWYLGRTEGGAWELLTYGFG